MEDQKPIFTLAGDPNPTSTTVSMLDASANTT